MSQVVFTDAAFAISRYPNNRFVIAGILGIEIFVRKGCCEDKVFGKHYRILVKFIIGVGELGRHSLGNRMVGFAHGHRKHMTLAMVALLPPAAGNQLLKFLVKRTAADECRGGMVINYQALATLHSFRECLLVFLRPASIGTSGLGVF